MIEERTIEKDNILLDQLEYDVIILGTSLTETILSAALAKAGKKVAHFDKNEWYGGAMTSQTLLGFKEHLNSTLHPSLSEIPENSFRIMNDNLKMPIINFSSSLFQYQPIAKSEKPKNENNDEKNELNEQLEEIRQQVKEYNVNNINNDNNNNEINDENNEKKEENNEKKESKNDDLKERKLRGVEDSQWKLLTKDDRRYCLDLICNVVWSSGEDVNYLVDSGVHRYLEFKTFQNSYIFSSSSQSLQLVPASKGEIFKTKYLSLMEKRSLTRFLNFCLAEEISADILKTNFKDFLNDQKLPPKLQEFLLYSVVFQTSSSSQITTEEGINKMKNYTKSMGRFGSTPFIFPLYGNSEFPQAFSRLSAVYGSDFVLKKTINYINLSDNNIENNNVKNDDKNEENEEENEGKNEENEGKNDENDGKKDEKEKKKIKNLNLCCSANQTLSTPFFVCSETYLSSTYRKVLSRAICITNKAIKDDGYLSYFVFPPTDQNPNTIFVHQFDGSISLSPQSKYVIHFTCLSHGETAKEDLQLAVETLLSTSSSNSSEDKPKVEYQMYFNTIAYEVDEEKLPENVIVARESRDLLIGFSFYFEQAKKIFYQICDADAEFLPSSNQINLEEELNEITHIESAFLNNNNNNNENNNENNNNNDNAPRSEIQSENQNNDSNSESNNNNNNSETPKIENSSDNNNNNNNNIINDNNGENNNE